MECRKTLFLVIWSIVLAGSVDSAMIQKNLEANVKQSGAFLVDKTPGKTVMLSHAVTNVEVHSKKSFIPQQRVVDDNEEFFVLNNIVRSKRQAEEFDSDSNPTGMNIKNIFTDMWQAILEGGKKIIKTAATALDRTASEADLKQ